MSTSFTALVKFWVIISPYMFSITCFLSLFFLIPLWCGCFYAWCCSRVFLHYPHVFVFFFWLFFFFHLLVFIFRFYIFIFLERCAEREEEKERNIHVKETAIGCLPYMPWPATKPTTQACTPTVNRTRDLLLCRWCATNWAMPVRASYLNMALFLMFLKIFLNYFLLIILLQFSQFFSLYPPSTLHLWTL